MGEPEIREALLARLGSDAGSVRQAAAWALAGAVREREVRDALLARLADDEVIRAGCGLRPWRARWASRRFARRCSPGSADDDGLCAGQAVQALAAAVGEAKVRGGAARPARRR